MMQFMIFSLVVISLSTLSKAHYFMMLKKIRHFGPSYVLPSYESLRTKGIDRRKRE